MCGEAAGALSGARFDVASCNHGLAAIDDLDGAPRTVSRPLWPGWRLTFSMLHPCFPGRPRG